MRTTTATRPATDVQPVTLRRVEIHEPNTDHEVRAVWRVVHTTTGHPALSEGDVIEYADRATTSGIVHDINDGWVTVAADLPDMASSAVVPGDDAWETVDVADLRKGERIVLAVRVGGRRRLRSYTLRNAAVRRSNGGHRHATPRLVGILHVEGVTAPIFTDPDAQIRLATSTTHTIVPDHILLAAADVRTGDTVLLGDDLRDRRRVTAVGRTQDGQVAIQHRGDYLKRLPAMPVAIAPRMGDNRPTVTLSDATWVTDAPARRRRIHDAQELSTTVLVGWAASLPGKPGHPAPRSTYAHGSIIATPNHLRRLLSDLPDDTARRAHASAMLVAGGYDLSDLTTRTAA